MAEQGAQRHALAGRGRLGEVPSHGSRTYVDHEAEDCEGGGKLGDRDDWIQCVLSQRAASRIGADDKVLRQPAAACNGDQNAR